MATKPFVYQDPYPLGEDKTEYRKVEGSEKYVSVASFEGNEILKVDPEALTLLANEAMRDISFLLRREHNESVGRILRDPEASQNDKGVAVAFLRNAEDSTQFELPVCQDTGTATIIAKKGQRIWTGGKDEEALSRGVYKTYAIEENLRYSQTVALDMYREVNSGTNCRPRSTSRRWTASPTSSSSWRKEAARPTRPPSSRRQRRCSPRKAFCNSWWTR